MIALAQRPYQNGKNVQPLTVGDIGAGAVIGVDEFYVAGSHGYYYHVMLGDWRPSAEVIPSFEAMARAIANTDR